MRENTTKYGRPTVIWEITLKCNLHCIHCGSSAGKQREKELSTDEALRLCDEFSRINVDEVCLIGGEPFLRGDWHSIASRVKDLDMRLSVVTSGYVNGKQDILNKLDKLEPFTVAVSLDGATPSVHDYIRGKKGAFDNAIEFIFSASDRGLPTTIVTTVSKINYRELPSIANIIMGKRIAWQIQVAAPFGRFKKELMLSEREYYAVGLFIAHLRKNYSKEEMPVIGAHSFGYYSKRIPCLGLYPEWKGCVAGLSLLGVQSNGNIKGCLALPDDFVEGNIRERSLVDIWEDPKTFIYNRDFSLDKLGDLCKGCPHGEVCRGGCNSMSVTATGKVFNTPLCFYRIEKYEPEEVKHAEIIAEEMIKELDQSIS